MDFFSLIDKITSNDKLFYLIVAVLVFISIIMIYLIYKPDKEKKVNKKQDEAKSKEEKVEIKEEKKEVVKEQNNELKEITKDIEKREVPIPALSEYEEEQEKTAIISYDELIKSQNKEEKMELPKMNTANIVEKNIAMSNEARRSIPVDARRTTTYSKEYGHEESFLDNLKDLNDDLK